MSPIGQFRPGFLYHTPFGFLQARKIVQFVVSFFHSFIHGQDSNEGSSACYLAALPLELVERILICLSIKDLAKARWVNKDWNSLISQARFWALVCEKRSFPRIERLSWKNTFWLASSEAFEAKPLLFDLKYCEVQGDSIYDFLFTNRLLITSHYNQKIKIQKSKTGKLIKEFITEEPHVEIKALGNFFCLLMPSGQLKAYDRQSLEFLFALTVGSRIQHLSLYENQLATAASNGSIKVWDLTTLTCISRLDHTSDRFIFLKIHEETLVAATIDGASLQWNFRKNELLWTNEQGPFVVRAAICDFFFATGDTYGNITIWNSLSGDCEAKLNHKEAKIIFLAYQGDCLISGNFKGSVRVWNKDSLALIGEFDHGSSILKGSIENDLCLTQGISEVKVWNWRKQKLLQVVYERRILLFKQVPIDALLYQNKIAVCYLNKIRIAQFPLFKDCKGL